MVAHFTPNAALPALKTILLATILQLALFCHISLAQYTFQQQNHDNLWNSFNSQSQGGIRAEDWFELDIGFLSLKRSQLDGNAFVFDQNGNSLLSASDLQGSAGRGFSGKLDFLNLLARGCDLQLCYFGSQDMLFDSEVSSSPFATPVFFSGTPLTPTTTYRIQYESNLNSFEANGNCPLWGKMKGLIGFRYLGLEERFDILNSANSNSTVRSGFFSGMDNDAWGGQIGLDGTILQYRGLALSSSLKYGLLGNHTRGLAEAQDGSGSPLITRSTDNKATQILDVSIGAKYWLVDWLGLYAGYQGLFGESFALAPTQSRDQSIFQPENNVTLESSQWHGYRLSMTLAW